MRINSTTKLTRQGKESQRLNESKNQLKYH